MGASSSDVPLAILLLLVANGGFSLVAAQSCPQEELDQCLRLADPFVQDPKFVFPVSQQEIVGMCGAWDRFTDCVRGYVLRCLSEDKRQEFDRAVQESEETMRQMCTDVTYQGEYLQNANCIKAVSVQPQRCGDRYNKLVSEVSNQLNQDALCCHFGKFRNCVLSMTNVDCGAGASNFAHHMIDKAMGFLLRSCQTSLQAEPIDECPSANSDPGHPSNTLGPGLNQAGAGQPTVLSPTPRPTARWSYDPQNTNNVNNNNGPSNGMLNPASLQGNAGSRTQLPLALVVVSLVAVVAHLWRDL